MNCPRSVQTHFQVADRCDAGGPAKPQRPFTGDERARQSPRRSARAHAAHGGQLRRPDCGVRVFMSAHTPICPEGPDRFQAAELLRPSQSFAALSTLFILSGVVLALFKCQERSSTRHVR